MSHLDPIFAAWDDNAEALAADIDEKGVTVRQWRNRRDIPSRSAQLKIIRAAFDKKGVVFQLEDFLSPDERLSLPGHAAAANDASGEPSATNGRVNMRSVDWPNPPADNSGEIIRDAAQEGGHRSPFSAASAPTCSLTSGPSNSSPGSPTCSPGAADAA